MGSVGREFSGAGLVGVILGATAATWIVLIFVAVLVLIGIAMIITALWVLQNADGDPQALRPLEVMGSRRFRSADPTQRRQQLDEVRPHGAGAPAPIVAAAATGRASGRPKTAPTDEKTTSTRRVRRYRAGDGPPDGGDSTGGDEVDARWGEPAADAEAPASGSSKRAKRTRESDAGLDDEADADTGDEGDDDGYGDADADGDGEDWWLDFDDADGDADQPAHADDDIDDDLGDDGDDDEVADDRGRRRTRDSVDSGKRSGSSANRSGSARSGRADQSYLDVLADWESDSDADWDDEPDWSAGSAGRRANGAADDYDAEYDDYDDEDDDAVDEPIENPDHDVAMGLVPTQRRRGAGRGSAGRWRRSGARGRHDVDYGDDDDDQLGELLDDDLPTYADADYENDDYENDDYEDDDYDEQDSDMDFDDDDYDGHTPTGTAPGSDPFFDDDFDGDWEESPKPQRSERPQRRPRSGSTGGGRARRRVPSKGMNSFDPEAMVDRFRKRAAAVRRRPLPPVAGEERQEFIRQAKIDYQDFAMIGDAEVTIEDGVLVLRLDLRSD